MDSTFRWHASSEADTEALGHALAEVVPPGTVIALSGTLGAGKTRLVKSLAAGLGVPAEEVISPTFVIMQRYEGTKTLYHFDVYRIQDDDEFLELGPDEYFDSQGITLLEWAERVESCLPPNYLKIHIEVLGETEREFTLEAIGEATAKLPQLVRENVG